MQIWRKLIHTYSQVAENKNQYVLRFLSRMVSARVFLACTLSFGLPGHGAGPNDGIAGTANTVSKHIILRSVPHLKQLLEPARIEVRVLSDMLHTHLQCDADEALLQITSAKDLFAWCLFFADSGVCMRARQFLGTEIDEEHPGGAGTAVRQQAKRRKAAQGEGQSQTGAARGEKARKAALREASIPLDPATVSEASRAWIGLPDGSSLRFLPAGAPCPYSYCHLDSAAATAKLQAFVKRPSLTRPDDAASWTSLFAPRPSTKPFSWPAPVEPRAPIESNEAIMEEVAKALQLRPTQVQHIFPQKIHSFLANAPAAHKKKALRMSSAEAKRRGVSGTVKKLRAEATREYKKALARGDVDSDEEVGRKRVRPSVVREMRLCSLFLTIDSCRW